MKNRLLLTYKIENDHKKNKLRELADSLDFRIKDIKEDQVGQKVGYLAELEGFKKDMQAVAKKAEEVELILFVNFEEEKLIEVLKELKKEGLYFPHKAGITDTSKDWEFNYLLSHIQKENEMVVAYSNLSRDVNYIRKKTDLCDEELERLMKEAESYGYMGDKLQIDMIRKTHKRLQARYRELTGKDGNENR